MSESQSSESFVSLTHIQKQLEQKWKHLVALALIWLHADYQQRTQQRLRFYLTRPDLSEPGTTSWDSLYNNGNS